MALACTCIAGAASAEDGPPKWTVGGLGLIYQSPFGAEGTSYNGVPYIAYRGERFYLEGTELGYHLMPAAEGASVYTTVDVIAAARMLPGSSRNKVTADAGLRLGLHGTFGSLTAGGLQDVTGTSDGQEVKVSYSYGFDHGDLNITPSVSAIWQSRKMANYMWGVTDAQHLKMIEDGKDAILPVYELQESVINYSASLMAMYRFSDNWSLIAFGSATYLDKAVRANPGITRDYDLMGGVGVAYSF